MLAYMPYMDPMGYDDFMGMFYLGFPHCYKLFLPSCRLQASAAVRRRASVGGHRKLLGGSKPP